MRYIERHLEPTIRGIVGKNKSVLLLGPRQTGKTTLIDRIQTDFSISLLQFQTRLRYEKNPGLLEADVKSVRAKMGLNERRPLIFIDEIQKIPLMMDTVQYLIDKKQANFILTGSSARKLKRGPNVNLLPGRVLSLRLDPLSLSESPNRALEDHLLHGSLPDIVLTEDASERESMLSSYVTTYLEEEVKAEALVRNLGSFARFLELAASESGTLVNFRKLSQDIGVSHVTIMSYYEILRDCLIVEMVPPFTKSKTRKKLTRSPKFMFFDLGVRRLAAEEGTQLSRDRMGHLFEQFVGLELIRHSRLTPQRTRVLFWRDPDGPEVDWIIDQEGRYTPIEVKMTDIPHDRDIKYLKTFLAEYPTAKKGYVVCQTPRPIELEKNIIAISWTDIPTLFFK